MKNKIYIALAGFLSASALYASHMFSFAFSYQPKKPSCLKQDKFFYRGDFLSLPYKIKNNFLIHIDISLICDNIIDIKLSIKENEI